MKTKIFLIAVALLQLTACDGRALSAKFSKPDRHSFPEDKVVCYTYSTTISCVKTQ